MNVLTAIACDVIMGLGAFTAFRMFVAAAISIVTVSREKKADKK